MKLIILVACALVAVAVAAPTEKVPEILEYKNEVNPDGTYLFSFVSDDGTRRSENAELKTVQDEDNKPVLVLVKRGSYTYVNSNGESETITYFADENGYHADGPSIPVAIAERR